ncbi:hypothetical protein HJC23_013081 [Cyclotella cryptica]|uniref:sn-1-specific diacylglycerol lipase n=1 Tax=Cyclotella cryptica TaxID=29204 RepID=A0ABD3Q7R2_9STRA
MPALKVFKNFSTRPFAGDDLHIICLVLGTYRVLQCLCLIPIIIETLVEKIRGGNLRINGYPRWCPQFSLGESKAFLVGTVGEKEIDDLVITVDRFGMLFTVVASIFVFVDFTWIMCVWSAASIGTPTQPMGRDEYLKPLIIFKMFAVNVFPLLLIALGIAKVVEGRQNNYGCGDEEPKFYPDDRPIYGLFCVLLFTFALELLVFPAILTNKIVHLIRSSKLVRKTYSTRAKGERLEQCLGMIFKCIALCSKGQGGHDLKNKGEWRDFASNLMEFANNDAKVDVVLSDMYVGGKLLARVQAERRFLAIQKLKTTSNQQQDESLDDDESTGDFVDHSTDRRQLLKTKKSKNKRILTLQPQVDGDYVVSEKNVLSSKSAEDVEILTASAHFSQYALYIYFDIFDAALHDFDLPEGCQTFVRDCNDLLNHHNDSFRLTRMGCEHAHLCYANFSNGIAATPYAILVDEMKETVVITVRGTNSLEDWVIDLQYVPLPLDECGSVCGFDGEGHYCHKGVLTRAKWMYNDMKENRVLKMLYSNDSRYNAYNLVVVGHSLGGGCATVLSLMLRPNFPNLKCFAFEPPGCIFDEKMAGKDEFFDVLARIRVPKIQAFRDIRSPILNDSNLAQRNSKVLCRRHEIERDTTFYEQVRKFRTERAAKNQTGDVSVKLYIPGRIIHLVDTSGDETTYIPYWASRYEFNQVVLSNTMLSDHSMLCLPDILHKLDLDNIHEVNTFHKSESNEEENEDPHFLKFMLCSFPNGRLPSLLVVSSLMACVFSLLSNSVCKYFKRESTLHYPNSTVVPGFNLSAGLYSYTLKQCKDNNCYEDNPRDLEDSKYCQPYPLAIVPDAYWKSARVFGAISLILGLFGLAFVSLATCTKMKKSRWKAACMIFLVGTLCQGLQFLLVQSNLCNKMPILGREDVAKAECSLAKGAFLSIAAMLLLFLNAIGCVCMFKIK